MSRTVFEVLDELRQSALDERDKGDKFERLIQSYLRIDPVWSAQFSDVWLWSEWPGRDNKPDTGIDLVAQDSETGGLTAIQCKFYAPETKIQKSHIDSFFTASGKEGFTRRLVVSTSDWSSNALDALQGQQIPTQRLDVTTLADSVVDWATYSLATPMYMVPRGPKVLRPHQDKALASVRRGLEDGDRGQMILACGTGKTFTSLRAAEELVGAGGSVLFLVPSIQLLSQSLREWMQEAVVDIRPFAVCSDVRVGRRTNSDDPDLSAIDLTEPATTSPEKLLARMRSGRHAHDRMSVVFGTYQSIDVIAEAQRQGLGEFDLVVCDEAHRTTGVTLSGEDESHFVKVHDQSFLAAKKRLYMTATPRVFSDDVKGKAKDAAAAPVSMDDETMFGPVLHRLGFGEAVEADLLTDYKVLVLTIDEQYVAENFQNEMAANGEITLGDAAKLIGCWNGLAKHYSDVDEGNDPTAGQPMRRAVAFAKDIRASKTATAMFPELVDRALDDPARSSNLRVQSKHVDGTMSVVERNTSLAWLKEDAPDDVCRILTNARCLSEGVDVPALDAVLFLTPRGSQVDVVQSVGRVMRKSPGKELGYIILPVVVPAGMAPEDALRDNDRYKVVWQVLQALRSHDDRFHAMINSLELNKRKNNDHLVIDDITPRPEDPNADKTEPKNENTKPVQLALSFDIDAYRDAMYARIVQKVGERRYWETWAADVADIAKSHVTRIRGLLADTESNPAKEFAAFLDGLRGNLNDSISADEAIEMLAQHLITRPVFEALFAGYDFAKNNPVARTMELMLDSLDEHNLDTENQTLEGFYDSVRRRVEGVTDADGKQRVIVELYDKFFSTAFKKTVDRLGIVYTPIEIVDFILKSTDDVLQAEFGQSISDEGVHVLDGFTGTGTFIVRLLQSGLIEPHDLARKYATELHANEMLLLAYYIAAVNIESTYAALTTRNEEALTYAPFDGLVLTDTFQSYEDGDRDDLNIFPENNDRIVAQRDLTIPVILGNPPYSVGQVSANDDNANTNYPTIDAAIRDTYAARSSATLKNSLYDSYIRAIKWASLRLADRGVIAYVTNGGFIDSNTADGLRKNLADEFSSIYIYNLRGNQRTAGEQSRKEGGKVFDAGSRATVAITLLVKNPDTKDGPATIHYTDIGDYLTREQKLTAITEAGSVTNLASVTITPNADGDWINQRRGDFETFMPIGSKAGAAIFALYAGGIKTNRDAWCYNFSRPQLARVTRQFFGEYEQARALLQEDREKEITTDPTRISWSRALRTKLSRDRPLVWDQNSRGEAVYRPFSKSNVHLDRNIVDEAGRIPSLFPTKRHRNVGFYALNPGAEKPFSALMTDVLPDLALYGSNAGQYFSRWTWEYIAATGDKLDFGDANDPETDDGYHRVDNITDEAIAAFAKAYPELDITKDDVFFYVYGLLHAPDYRATYAADLKRMLPRVPLVPDFEAFVTAGRALADLHVGYESVEPYPLEETTTGDSSETNLYRVQKMTFGKGPRVDGRVTADRSAIVYNPYITLTGIPEDAYRYMLGSRSAIEWIMERYQVKTDKASGIVNDPNDWAIEHDQPRYILDLLKRIVTVSVRTNGIVDRLPALKILTEP